MSKLEHVNVTVSDPQKTAELLCELFGWKIRWAGNSSLGGNTVHVGGEDDYVAVYTYGNPDNGPQNTGRFKGGLNHIGVVVEDLNETEQRILNAGFKTHSHGDYEPGRRFYFNDADDIEFEVVCYN